MNDLTPLYQQIEALSPENQNKVADYVAFLQWQNQRQPEQAIQWSFSLIERFHEATVYATAAPNGLDVKQADATVGGETRPSLWAHPPVVGQTVIEYHLPIPADLAEVALKIAVGIRDGSQLAPDSLVAFSVLLNGSRVWGHQTTAQTWHDVTVPLDLPLGDVSRLALVTEALGNHQWTWAVWGSPDLVGR